MEVRQEYERIKKLFEGVDEKQLELLEGPIWEFARLRVELDQLNNIIKETGHVKVHPENPLKQKELPASKVVVKVRANYLNYGAKLSSILGKNVLDDGENDLGDYE